MPLLVRHMSLKDRAAEFAEYHNRELSGTGVVPTQKKQQPAKPEALSEDRCNFLEVTGERCERPRATDAEGHQLAYCEIHRGFQPKPNGMNSSLGGVNPALGRSANTLPNRHSGRGDRS